MLTDGLEVGHQLFIPEVIEDDRNLSGVHPADLPLEERPFIGGINNVVSGAAGREGGKE
jgi:hypothetical protein